MNPAAVREVLPLLKFEIIQTTDDEIILVQSAAMTIAEGMERKYTPLKIQTLDSLENAFQMLMSWYTHINIVTDDVEVPSVDIKHHFQWTEIARGRDSGNSWSDPYNDVRKYASIDIKTLVGTDQEQTYSIGYSAHSPMYGVCKTYTTFVRMLESCLPTKSEIKDIVAFEWRDMVFVDVYVMQDQLCISGTSIDGAYYNDHEEDHSVKVDYFQDYVNFQKRNEIYIVGRAFYMNGEKLFAAEELIEKIPPNDPQRQDPYMRIFSVTKNGFYGEDAALQWIEEHYPEATCLNSEGGWRSLNRDSSFEQGQIFSPLRSS